MSETANIRKRVTEAVDRSADTAEEIHRSIANIPLDLLGRVENLEDTIESVRRLQDRSISAVYDLVRGINREVGRLADDLIRGPRAARRKPPVRKARKTRRSPPAKAKAAV